MELVVIAQFPTGAEAAMAKNYLANEGIEAQLSDENTGDLFHLSADFGEVKVLVKSDDAERAKEILQAAHEHPLAPGEPPGEQET